MPTAAGLHYVYIEGGDNSKPPVLLIHGAGGDHLSWPPELRRLPHYRIYAVDLPGHGKTIGPGFQSIEDHARTVVKFFDEVGLSRVVIVGVSMGGAIALSLAVNYPERIAGITLISTGARLPVPSSILENAASPSTYPLAVKSLMDMYSSPQTPDALKDTIQKRLLVVRQTLLLSDLLACDRFDILKRLEEIRIPALIICGRQDKITPVHFSEILSSRIPGAALQTVEDTGHLLVFEHPGHIAKLVAVFLATIPYQPGG
jgi:pimeloyl-ACP methyl ester carboxylesterase